MKIEVNYKPTFIRNLNRLENALREEVIEKIELFKNTDNHKTLKVHKLHGPFIKYYSFSVNYKTRIIFEFVSKKETVLLSIGDHDIYK
ncbi:MAG: type II toxin-antitoxin system mRNA interferase toxin, RelE/StbE family [Patescibacteria group bacterium]